MAISQLYFKKGNYIEAIELDIIITEGAQSTVRLTSNPVENGANSNDHIIFEPMTFTVEGMISDTTTKTFGQLGQIGRIVTKTESKSKEAWEDLLNLQMRRTPFTLFQGLKSYENVIILTLEESQDKDTSNALFFTATLKELIFVGTQVNEEDQFDEDDISDSMTESTKGGLKQAT